MASATFTSAAVLICLVLAQLSVVLAGNRGWLVDVKDKKAAMAHAHARKASYSGNAKRERDELAEWWDDFKQYHNKTYANPREQARALQNFKTCMQRVQAINADANLPYWASGNRFCDLDFATFQKQYLTAVAPGAARGANRKLISGDVKQVEQQVEEQGFELLVEEEGVEGVPVVRSRSLLAVPNAVNWTAAGKVTPVKNQGRCGNCWAFAATGAIESAYLLSTATTYSKTPVDLSEQQMTSCETRNKGCNGGDSGIAIDYTYRKPFALESRWPYKNGGSGTTISCSSTLMASATKAGTTLQLASSYMMATRRSYTALQAAVAKQPVVVYVAVDNNFMYYRGGVFKPSSYSTSLNHAVLVTGYDIGKRSWSIKNSWGTGWGEKGYIRVHMAYDSTGISGMYSYALFPPMKFQKTFSSTTLSAIRAKKM